jgi:hypothetical protein
VEVRERERDGLGVKKHVDCAEEDRWTLKIKRERKRERGGGGWERGRNRGRKRESLHHGHSRSCRGD